MKKACLLVFICFAASICFAAFPPPSADSARLNVLPQQPIAAFPDLEALSRKDFEQQSGRKLSLPEKVSFWLVKKHLLKADGGSRGSAGSAIGGFFLGFLLPVLGLVIAYLLPKNKTLRLWAWIGTGVFAIVFLFLLALGSAFNWT